MTSLKAPLVERPYEHVSRVGHHQDQGPDGSLAVAIGIEDLPQLAKVQFQDLDRFRISHANGGAIAFGS